MLADRSQALEMTWFPVDASDEKAALKTAIREPARQNPEGSGANMGVAGRPIPYAQTKVF